MAGKTHIVSKGECLAKIASNYGFSWQAIWNSPENGALRRKRKDPNVLLPGDIIVLPNPAAKQVPVEMGKAHKFVLKRQKLKVYLRLTANQKPLASEPWQLEYGEREIQGQTDGDGVFEAEIPVEQTELVLSLPRRQQTFTLALGEVDPIDTLRGAQTRLHNLGLYRGEISGTLDDATVEAIRMFQQVQKLSITGRYDSATQRALAEFHGF